MSFVIMHPRFGVYIGDRISEGTGKVIHRFSWKKARTDAVKVFETVKEAQAQVGKIASGGRPELRRCYPVQREDLARKKP